MASRTGLSRLVPRFNRRWLIGLVLVAVGIVVVRSMPTPVHEPPLDLVALGPDGGFRDTLDVPASWMDTATTAGGVMRVPLVLGVRNTGERSGRPERLFMSLPLQYRLTGTAGPLDAALEVGTPLVNYSLATGLGPVEPGRLPALLPAHDTLWLELLIPRFYCVAVADSVPEFIPAPPPAPATLSEVRIFYSFEGGDLTQRRTGTLRVRLDTTMLALETREPPPTFPVVMDSALASPPLGELRLAGRRISQCGEPPDPLELRSTLWLTARGGRVIDVEYAGKVRKRLYDLEGDGIIERESWDADGDGTFEATREARLPTPEFLFP